MTQWEYKITIHELPGPQAEERGPGIECDLAGQCFVPRGTVQGGLGWLETLFCDRGKEGWELVQSGYHQRELLCIWKKKVSTGRKG